MIKKQKALERIAEVEGNLSAAFRSARRALFDQAMPSFEDAYPKGGLYTYAQGIRPAVRREGLASRLNDLYWGHRFDLLGSGWVHVHHAAVTRGLEGHRHERSNAPSPDPDGAWLQWIVNRSNLRECRRIWRMIRYPVPASPSPHDEKAYVPIDWQRDVKSGYRWSERTWHKRISYGHLPGVDVKVPWELARMQHLPQLALACARAMQGAEGFSPPSCYAREFRRQVLDFIATNPPRWGVNWCKTMEVAVRAVNLAVGFDLFNAFGVRFDSPFREIVKRSLYEHGLHICNHLEGTAFGGSNHYLADIVGLLFTAAYLPRAPRTDAWLAFAVQELIRCVRRQFHPDGSHFESSTAYHALCSEMVVYATALILGLSEDKKRGLQRYDPGQIRGRTALQPPPVPFFNTAEIPAPSPFPSWYLTRLRGMAAFLHRITMPDGRMAQIGDNDSGRLLKLAPVLVPLPLEEAAGAFANLFGASKPLDGDVYLMEDSLDTRPLEAAFRGLPGDLLRRDRQEKERPETALVRAFCGRAHTPPSTKNEISRALPPAGHTQGNHGEEPRLYAFPYFGAYVFHSGRFQLVFRCSTLGQNGRIGHAHNDQLSFELAVDGRRLMVDPGTYVYTPLPHRRNRFRSTAMHNTVSLEGKEQNDWPRNGVQGLFRLQDRARAVILELSNRGITAEHAGFEPQAHRRSLRIGANGISGTDCVTGQGEKRVRFHLAPGIDARALDSGDGYGLYGEGRPIASIQGGGKWKQRSDAYSPGYGWIREDVTTLELVSDGEIITWGIQWDPQT